jgi:hypothetical protein
LTDGEEALKAMPTSRSRSRRGERQPVRLTKKKLSIVEKEEGGPLEWFLPTMEAAYLQVVPREAEAAGGLRMARSTLRARTGAVLDAPQPRVWRDLLREYKSRKAAAVAPLPSPLGERGLAAPIVPGGRNWRPLGPSVVLDGQTVGEEAVAGRIAGLAVARNVAVVYAATANGGVFRSTDGGASWDSLMDRFDLDPTSFASASLISGAIAIDQDDPNRVYVGTGEGDTLQLFRLRIINALPAYRGVGPIRSDDGGVNWFEEPSSPSLDGEAFFSIAVDPGDRENVVAGTTAGLYRREPAPWGGHAWQQRRAGVFPSVAVARAAGSTRFFCAEWAQGAGSTSGVLRSDDNGATWQDAGDGLPAAGVGRIALGVQPDNPDLVYAFVTKSSGALHGLFRLEGVGGRWRQVTGVPDVLPGEQGTYDLTIAVDPVDGNTVYLGGDRTDSPPWPGSVWRCTIAVSDSSVRVARGDSIGTHAHADVHVLTHTPGNPNELWCGCDGGVFLNRDPRQQGEFSSRNNGLACLCTNFLAQHPTDPSILFTGLQDNGTAQTQGDPIWTHVSGGDGGYCLINWAEPDQVLVFQNGQVLRSTTGGTSDNAWSMGWDFPWATMTQPIVGAPFNPQKPAEGRLVAAAAGNTIVISTTFAASWSEQFTLPGGSAAGSAFAVAFATPSRLFIGTTVGRVFRAEKSASEWTVNRIDNAAAGAIGVVGLINDIAVDWRDPDLESVYVCFGGMGDARRVWWFDGTVWQVRSGSPQSGDLLDVEHNALVVDPERPDNVYVGADIGVWHSPDAGESWAPLQNGLPDAPVFDLQIHPTRRLLRAATHGRGLFELDLT